MNRFRRTFGQRGEGNLGCILWAVVLIIVVFVAWKMVPVKIASAKFSDYMEEQAKFAKGTPEKQIYQAIIKKASELELPVEPKNLIVERTNDRVKMSVKYTVPIEFPGYTYNWHFEHEIDRNIYYL
jgi:hypothetical protein